MHQTVQNLLNINTQIKAKINELKYNNYKAEIIAISKTFSISHILPLIDYGHIHFGENKVQEAIEKWMEIKTNNKNIKLHMVGKLQTNKVKIALKVFDFIHSLDNLKLAEKISSEQNKIKKRMNIFIQVNIGYESQKSGIHPNDINFFIEKCKKELNLNIIGLMCIPPNNDNYEVYFSKMKKLLGKTDLKNLSMGMSNDYLKAIDYGSNFLRIGSKIFGERS